MQLLILWNSITWISKKIIGIATDCAPSMIGKNARAMILILREIKTKKTFTVVHKKFICHYFLQP